MDLFVARLKESAPVAMVGGPRDPSGKVWDVCVIASGWSTNIGPESKLPVFYHPRALQEAVAGGVFDGLKASIYRLGPPVLGAIADHVPVQISEKVHKENIDFAENTVGFYRNIRYGKFMASDHSEREGVLAELHLLEGSEALRKNLVDAWERGHKTLYGLSIDADGMARVGVIEGRKAEVVEKILRASSTDIVSKPAAGGEFLRLVASCEGVRNMKSLIAKIAARRAGWQASIPSQGDGEDQAKYARRLVEAAEVAVKKEMCESAEPAKLVAAAKDMAAIQKALGLLGDGKVEEAMKVLEDALSEAPPAAPPPAPMKAQESAAAQAPDFAPEITRLRESQRQAEETNRQMQATLHNLRLQEAQGVVTGRLAASGVSAAIAARVRKQFANRVDFGAADVDGVIVEERNYAASLQESGRPHGLGGAHGASPATEASSVDRREKLRKAMEGMFAGVDIDGVPRFTGLRASWDAFGNKSYANPMATAAAIFQAIGAAFPSVLALQSLGEWGGDNPFAEHHQKLRESFQVIGESNWLPRRLRESVTTADWPVVFGDGLYKRFETAYKRPDLNDWRKVANIENLGDWTNSVKIIRRWKFQQLPTVAQNAPYQSLTPATPTEEYESLTPVKKGGKFAITMEDVMADRIRALQVIPDNLAEAALRTIHFLVWDLLESNATVASAALLHANHSNIISGSPTLSGAAVNAGLLLLREQTEFQSGYKGGLRGKYLITGPKKAQLSHEICRSGVKPNSAEDSTLINYIRDQGIEPLDTIGVGLTSTTDDYYWIMADPREKESIVVGFPGGRDKPDILVQGEGQQTQGSVFDADAITFKERLIVGATLTDYRGIVGSQATS